MSIVDLDFEYAENAPRSYLMLWVAGSVVMAFVGLIWWLV